MSLRPAPNSGSPPLSQNLLVEQTVLKYILPTLTTPARYNSPYPPLHNPVDELTAPEDTMTTPRASDPDSPPPPPPPLNAVGDRTALEDTVTTSPPPVPSSRPTPPLQTPIDEQTAPDSRSTPLLQNPVDEQTAPKDTMTTLPSSDPDSPSQTPYHVMDFILWIAKETKFQGRIGLKSHWTSEEIQKALAGHLDAHKKMDTSYYPGKKIEPLTLEQAVVNQGLTFQKRRENKRLIKYHWEEFAADAKVCLERVLVGLGVTLAEYNTYILPTGQPDLYRFIERQWYLQNPPIRAPEYMVFVAKDDDFGGVTVPRVHVKKDADFDQFMNQLNDIAPFPDYISDEEPENWDSLYQKHSEQKRQQQAAETGTPIPSAPTPPPKSETECLWTYRLIGEAQITDLFEQLAEAITRPANASPPPRGPGYGEDFRLKDKEDFYNMKRTLLKKDTETPFAILVHVCITIPSGAQVIIEIGTLPH
jgi:hypothetical protein